jgi:hypothetical protein
MFPLCCLIATPFERPYPLNGDPRRALVGGIFLVAGTIVGGISSVYRPALVPSGRWIWTAPVLLFVLVFGFDMSRSDPSEAYTTTSYIIMIYFYSNGNDEGLTSYFATYPALASIGYSFSMWLVGRRKNGSLLQADPAKSDQGNEVD